MHRRLLLVILVGVFAGSRFGVAFAAPFVSFDEPRFVSVNKRNAPGEWPLEYNLGSRVSLTFDSTNRPHIAYVDRFNGHALKYARWTGSSWEVTPLYDRAPWAYESVSSIAVDAAGNPHIAITGTQHIFRSGGIWQREMVEVKIASPSVRIGPDGQPRVAYIQESGSSLVLRYAARNPGGTWSYETVRTMSFPTAGWVSPKRGWCSLALDSSGNPNIAYYDTGVEQIRYVLKSGINWVVFVVDSSSADTGRPCAIAMDSLNRRYIAYLDATNGRIKIAYQTSSGWVQETLGTLDNWVGFIGKRLSNLSVAVAPDGTIAVAYVWGASARVHRRIGGVWHLTEIPANYVYSYDDFAFAAIAFNSAGVLGLAFCGQGPGPAGSLHYYTITGPGSGSVSAQLVDPNPRMGKDTIGISRNGDGVIYNNPSMQSLSVCHAQQPNLNNAVFRRYYDGLVTRGPYQDLAADVDRVGVNWYASVYEDLPGQRRLLLASTSTPDWYFPISEWEYEVVDQSATDVGRFNSLVAASDTSLHISYYDATNGDLKHARRSPGGAWTVTTVDATGNVGWDTSIALNAGGLPRISYYDATNQDLKFAYLSGSSWAVTTVDSTGSVGEYSSLVYDSSNRPHISYYDRTNRQLKYAKGPIGSWAISVVDTGNVGEFSGLALDGVGNPHIVYYDSGQRDLKYAWFNGTSWDIRRLDSVGDVGRNAVIGISGSRIRICYYDDTQGGVKEIWGQVDYTGPSAVSVTDEGEFTTDSSRLSASWTQASDPETGIFKYRYAIGTTPSDPGSGYVIPWKEVSEGTTSMTETGLSLQNGQIYYIYVSALNWAGEWGPVAASDGIRVVSSANNRIAEAKRLPDDTWVRLTGKVVSREASFYFCYIQEPDRSSGILVYSMDASLPAFSLVKGREVSIVGVVGNRGGNRVIYQPVVQITGTQAPPRPVSLRNIEVGGTDFFYVPGPVRSGQKGVPGRRGLNNVGLYVRTTGRVVAHSYPTMFVIDDGSLPGGLPVKHEIHWGQPPVGSLVEVFGYPTLGDFEEGPLYMEGSGAWRVLD
ncbi:MAG: hypothetical protein KatS3mg024_0435 [Armatimonadota bacterium]|nr:MAG: hypothetical protein KatS3mg024_0435 [Armatimonadota bacterium]